MYSGHPSDTHCRAKRDTITTYAIFSFNGRRLVTSLILVITTIILLVLLVVNLNCNIFTEATVNTTTTPIITAPTIPLSLVSTSRPASPSSTSQTPLFNITNSGTSETSLVGSNSLSNDNGVKPPILAKIKSETNITGGSENSTPDTTANSTNLSMASNNIDTNSTGILGANDQTPREDPCAELTPDRYNAGYNNETSRYFDIDYAAKTFEDSMADKNAISLHHYLNGFKELMKFFHNLGTIFLFVTSDLESKIGLLENYRNAEKGGCNTAYLTIQSAIEYETKENLLRDTKRQSAARTILRLHRALEFLSALMLNLSKLEQDAETAMSVREAYLNTLAKHHPWTIRTIASFAMRTLPNKKNLVESVLGKAQSTNETLTDLKMLTLSNVTGNLFNVVDKFYEERELKDLP